MGDNYKIMPTQRTTWHRVSEWIIKKLDNFKDKFVTQEGITLAVKCPHCRADVTIVDLMMFNRIYEFSCTECQGIFTVAIPDLVIKKGLIEGTFNDQPNQIKQKPVTPATVQQAVK